MKYYILASGSSGNCSAFVNDEGEILLIDCGISLTEIKKRFMECNLDFYAIKKVIITHMHNDHCLSRKAFSPSIVYAHKDSQLDLPTDNLIEDYTFKKLLGFEILFLPMSHDCKGTIGLVMEYKDEKIAYITDTGYLHQNIQRLINNCSIYIMESNHDPRMLMLTNRPPYLKSRILSVDGHLSNQDCDIVLSNVIGCNTKEIVFIHRSKEANSEALVLETFKKIMQQREVDVSNINLILAQQNSWVMGGAKYEYQE